MKKYETLEKELEKKFSQRDKKLQPKMKVTGKSVFKLQELITRPYDQLPKRKHPKKNG
jgi:hypothetical protein